MEDSKQIIFNIDEEEYAIEIESVKGIERQMQIVKVPNRPPYILGIINLRGDIIPVFSLKVKFGHDESIDGESKMIITNAGGMTIALKVDEVNEIIEVPGKDIYDLPVLASNEHTGYISNIAKINNRLVIILNLNGIINEQEANSIKKMLQDVEN